MTEADAVHELRLRLDRLEGRVNTLFGALAVIVVLANAALAGAVAVLVAP